MRLTLTTDELEMVRRAAAFDGLSVSAYMRGVVLADAQRQRLKWKLDSSTVTYGMVTANVTG